MPRQKGILGITSTRTLTDFEVAKINAVIKVAKSRKDKIKNLSVGFGTLTQIVKGAYLFTHTNYVWNEVRSDQRVYADELKTWIYLENQKNLKGISSFKLITNQR
tara:strand:- start:293 stop:607 length:315 start_codon:yes stop_codon:yes gene_type:complete